MCRNNYLDIEKVKEEKKLERKSKIYICFFLCYILYAKLWSFHFVAKVERKYAKMLKHVQVPQSPEKMRARPSDVVDN